MKLKNEKSSYPPYVFPLSKMEMHLYNIAQAHVRKLNKVLDLYKLTQPPYAVLYEKMDKKYKLSEKFVYQNSELLAIRYDSGGKKYLCYVGFEEIRVEPLDLGEKSRHSRLLDQYGC